MSVIRVFSWKPPGINNFGDEIGPLIVERLCKLQGLEIDIQATTSGSKPKMLCVGSILHEAKAGDVVWGSGVNPKNRPIFPKNAKIEFSAVRGPLTRTIIIDQGLDCAPIYGDPGLLFSTLFDYEVRTRRAEIELSAQNLGVEMPDTVVIPNINDDRFLPYFSAAEIPKGVMVVRPSLDPWTVAAYISSAKTVISSSLHGLIFSEAYGRRTIRLQSQYEPEFKYSDYFLGTGREVPAAYENIEKALNGNEIPALNWEPGPLLRAFPLTNQSISSWAQSTFVIDIDRVYNASELSRNGGPFGKGWLRLEDERIWTADTWCEFSVVLKGEVKAGATLRMDIGTLEKGQGPFTLLRIVHAGKMIASIQVERKTERKWVSVPLPSSKDGAIELSFKVENPVEVDTEFGKKALGVWLSQLEVVG